MATWSKISRCCNRLSTFKFFSLTLCMLERLFSIGPHIIEPNRKLFRTTPRGADSPMGGVDYMLERGIGLRTITVASIHYIFRLQRTTSFHRAPCAQISCPSHPSLVSWLSEAGQELLSRESYGSPPSH